MLLFLYVVLVYYCVIVIAIIFNIIIITVTVTTNNNILYPMYQPHHKLSHLHIPLLHKPLTKTRIHIPNQLRTLLLHPMTVTCC